MDRRKFLVRTGLVSAALASAGSPGTNVLDEQALAAQASRTKRIAVANDQLTWHLEWHSGQLISSAFENKLSGRTFLLSSVQELALNLSASKHRVEISWWKFTFGAKEAAVSPDQEHGFRLGFHHPEVSDQGWGATENLLLRGLRGLRDVPRGIIYPGFGWFRHWFELPNLAQSEETVIVLGGYDQLDWNEYWIYLNGVEVGHRVSGRRWRTPEQFTVAPGSPGHSALRFGSGQKNLLAVRARGYDKHFGGFSDEMLKHYVFEPVLADQFISVGQPYLRVADFEVQGVKQDGQNKLVFDLQSLSKTIHVSAHYELRGSIRRKWLEITNVSSKEMLLLDVQLDDYTTVSSTSEGGLGQPVILGEEAFSAIEHPAGLNEGDQGRVRLTHFPARRLSPGASLSTHVALLAVAKAGQALEQFVSYIGEGSPRKKRVVSLYTPYGINNQWGGCPPLADVEALDILRVLESWQGKGLKFDYFTLDQGWMDSSSDLTRFAPQCYPNGPALIVERVRNLGMKFGLWFSVSGAGWSCGEFPAVEPSFAPSPGGPDETTSHGVVYRNGYIADGGVPGQLCVASEPYFSILKNAVLYHVRQNNLKFFKLDIGNYYCNSTHHGHLPGKYSVEAMYERLIEIAKSAREAEPDIYVMWYWGIRSPFFALYGDSIFESGLFMEGSGTSWFPTLYYRDSVTLNLDQSTQFAKTIPPINKDSLGVWLSDIRWGNFMGNERWREALIMDLGRGNLLFPQIWSDIYLLSDRDVEFLVEMISLVKKNEFVLLKPRHRLGDPWRNDVYGYSYFDGAHGFIFINNVHFGSRKLELRLGPDTGLDAAPGTPVQIVSLFPERKQLIPVGGVTFKVGESAEVWVRPFEVLMLEVVPAATLFGFPPRQLFAEQAAGLGISLPLQSAPLANWMDIRLADAARFEGQGYQRKPAAWTTSLPPLEGEQHLLAVVVRLREDDAEWLYSPAVVEIVQAIARIGEQKIPLIPVPDARQFGNTQKAGCSWVVYKARLNSRWSGQRLQFAVLAYLPEAVKPHVEAWVVRQWWEESARPLGDGYYGDAPS